ncbi:NifB/NifX family molybdenum-iron cluster-binding protein [Haloferula sargassicola]|uniref:Dinitrogenase iron-molybdenum cofactor biosynthesis domain-containing protein n=1 Tax=Haloferula sargassicola TaxID=490096 RepID=A0ABP9UHV3_9BACT
MNPTPPTLKKTAVATELGRLSAHFGRTDVFAVFTETSLPFDHPVYRVNTRPEDPEGSHHEDHHRAVAELLGDCSIVICGGIGDRAANMLKAAGIRVLVSTREGSAEEIYRDFREGKLPVGKVHRCCCSGH